MTDIEQAQDEKALQDVKVKYLGKRSSDRSDETNERLAERRQTCIWPKSQ